MSAITRRNAGSGHTYSVDGVRFPGVTTILGVLAKDNLIEWAGRTTAAYAVDYWQELAALNPSKRLDRLNRARFEDRDAGARKGTQVHRLGAALVAGEEVAVPDELAGHVEAYVDFLDKTDAKAVLVETVIANRTVRYCGTLDLVCDMAGCRWLLDLKTARSGIFAETALQLCAYANAEVYVDGDLEVDMRTLGIEKVGALWVRADGWDLHELQVGDEVWQMFRHLAWLQRHLDDKGRLPMDWVGPTLEVAR